MSLRIRRGITPDLPTPVEGELLYTTDTGKLYVGFYNTETEEVEPKLVTLQLEDENSPTLQSNLDLNGNNIIGVGNINIDGVINATGNINLGDGSEDNVIVGGQIASSLIPRENNLYNLGETSAVWAQGFFNSIEIKESVEAKNLYIDNIYSEDSSVLYNGSNDTLSVSTVNGNLQGSILSDDSTIVVDAIEKELNTELLNIASNTITTLEFDGEINFQTNNSAERLRINYLSNGADFTIKDFGIADGVLAPGTFFNTQRTSIDSPAPVETGDALAQYLAAGWDGDSYTVSSIIIHEVDQYQSVSDGYVPGALKLHTFDTDTLNPKAGKGIEIDSRGFVGILNDYQPEAALDVNGSAIIRGTVTADFVGTVSSDNSTTIIDGVNGEVVGPIRNLTVLGNTGIPENTDGLAPTEWLELSVNGSTRYIPLYN